MVIRKRKGTVNSDTYSLNITYSEPDVRAKLKDWVLFSKENFGTKSTFHSSWTEQDLIQLISVRMFKEYAEKYQKELSVWAFRLSLKKGLLIKSTNNENAYYFAESLGVRTGRPPKEPWLLDADLR